MRRTTLTWWSLLALGLVISLWIAIVLAVNRTAPEAANRVACRGNFHRLYMMAVRYADRRGFAFIGDGEHPRAHESFNVLMSSDIGDNMRFSPHAFACQTWTGPVAVPADDGTFTLRAENCGYMWVADRHKIVGSFPLSSDKYVKTETQPNGHLGGRNVLLSDGSVRWVPVDELDPDKIPEGLTR